MDIDYGIDGIDGYRFKWALFNTCKVLEGGYEKKSLNGESLDGIYKRYFWGVKECNKYSAIYENKAVPNFLYSCLLFLFSWFAIFKIVPNFVTAYLYPVIGFTALVYYNFHANRTFCKNKKAVIDSVFKLKNFEKSLKSVCTKGEINHRVTRLSVESDLVKAAISLYEIVRKRKEVEKLLQGIAPEVDSYMASLQEKISMEYTAILYGAESFGLHYDELSVLFLAKELVELKDKEKM